MWEYIFLYSPIVENVEEEAIEYIDNGWELVSTIIDNDGTYIASLRRDTNKKG